MSKSFTLLFAFVAAVVSASTSSAQPISAKNLKDAGKFLGEKVGDYLATADTGQTQLLVATFRFGDEADNVSSLLGMAPTQLQGHIIESLQKTLAANSLGGRFSVLDVDQLDQQTGGSVLVKISNPATTRVRLSNKNIGVGVVGTILKQPSGDYLCSARVITPFDVSAPIEVKVSGPAVDLFTPQKDLKISGRFNVEIFATERNTNNRQKLQLRRANNQSGPFRNALYLQVDRTKYFGQPFEVRLTNNKAKSFTLPIADGTPGPNDKDRVFGAAVYLDGVSSMFIETSKNSGLWRKDIRHPAYVGKHILTADNRKFVVGQDDTARFFKGKLVNATPPGHSVWRVQGFQKGDSTAASFLLGTAAQSVGTGMGQNVNQIGLISVFFYAEHMSDDMVPSNYIARDADIGTIAGPDIPSVVTEVGVKDYYPYPAEVWHIQYVYSDDPDVPDLGPPVQPGN